MMAVMTMVTVMLMTPVRSMMVVMTVMLMAFVRSMMVMVFMPLIRSMMVVMAMVFMVLMSAIRQYLLIFSCDLVLFIETAHRNTPSAPGGQFLFHFTHASDDGNKRIPRHRSYNSSF
jgi:hypothetical protein